MILLNIIQMYIAYLIVITLHELGHFPRKIKYKWGIFPSAVALQAKYRLGGLIVNVLLAFLIFIYKPGNLLLQYVGLVAWIHFIMYAIIGSIIPEPKPSTVNIKTYIFDDVDNKKAPLFIIFALILFWTMKNYYAPILVGVFE